MGDSRLVQRRTVGLLPRCVEGKEPDTGEGKMARPLGACGCCRLQGCWVEGDQQGPAVCCRVEGPI